MLSAIPPIINSLTGSMATNIGAVAPTAHQTIGVNSAGNSWALRTPGWLDTAQTWSAAQSIAVGGTINLFNTADQTTNYERLTLDWSGNVVRFFTAAGGTGAQRDLRIGQSTGAYLNVSQNYPRFTATTNGTIAGTGNLFQIGTTSTASSGTYNGLAIVNTYQQSSTAGGVDFLIDRTNTSVGSGSQYLIIGKVAGSAVFRVDPTGQLFINTIVDNAGNNTPLTLQTRDFSAAATAVRMSTGSFTNSSGTVIGVSVNPNDATTGTGGITALQVNLAGAGTGSGAKKLASFQQAGVEKAAIPSYCVSLPITLGRSAVAQSVTGTLTETTLATITVPANSLGANGRVRITTVWSMTNSANNKTTRIRYSGASGTSYMAVIHTTSTSYRDQREICNRNATNSQVGGPVGGFGGFGNNPGNTVATSTVDTTVDQTIVITGTLANTGETITLESYLVELIP